jgi:hypothetical protein
MHLGGGGIATAAEFVNSRPELHQVQSLKPGQTHQSKAVGEGFRRTMTDG